MGPHTDILDHSESLRNPFLGSILFHAALVGTFVLLSVTLDKNREVWGSANPSAGGSVAVTPVKTIPLPSRRGRPNPVANDTESLAAQAQPDKVVKRKNVPDPDAIALKSKKKEKVSPNQASTQRYHPPEIPQRNQVLSNQAPAAVSPIFQKAGGPGTVGLDQNSVLGSRFGGYAMLLMQRVSEHWRTSGLENVRSPFAIVSVDLFRNGTIKNPKLEQSSGNYQLDNSAIRAVTEAVPFPPLPAEYEHDKVNIEFRFQIKQ